MGIINHGTQTITFDYYLEAKGEVFAKLFKSAMAKGIYEGGYISKVTDAEIQISSFELIIKDSTHCVM